MRTLFAVVVAVLLFIAVATALSPPAAAQQCSARKDVLDLLKSKYQEEVVAMGLASSGAVVEVLVSPKGETWTIMITRPDGKSCITATGESWEMKITPVGTGA